MENVTPHFVRKLSHYTEDFLCKVSENIFHIRFLKFRVRDLDSETVLFEVEDEKTDEMEKTSLAEIDENRLIRYHLGPEFLDIRNLGTQITFIVGDSPVKNLVMIERHYFKEKLLKNFEFSFDFCIPNSTNEWETLYTLPKLAESLKEEMIKSPWEIKSDSFYFVDNKLVMHYKAIYNYSLFD